MSKNVFFPFSCLQLAFRYEANIENLFSEFQSWLYTLTCESCNFSDQPDELHAPSDDRAAGGTSSTTLVPDDNDSDCISNTTSSSALTALSTSVPHLNSKGLTTSKQQAYDNPCLSDIAEGSGIAPDCSGNNSGNSKTTENLSSTSGGSNVPSSISMPASLKNSASSPLHTTMDNNGNSSGKLTKDVTSPVKITSNGNSSISTTTPPHNYSSNNSHTNGMHSRADSWVSGGMASGTHTVCHSRGASTDASTIDVLSSATESRRGTYSEAGTVPIGSLMEGSLGDYYSIPKWYSFE